MAKTGFVKFFDRDRGFGFVVVDGEDRGLFAHVHELQTTNLPRAGQRIRFETGISERTGLPVAKNLTVIDEEEC